jgi:hypothetical protein
LNFGQAPERAQRSRLTVGLGVPNYLQRLAAITSRTDLAAELRHLHRMLYLLVQGAIFPSLTDPGSKEPLFGFFSY